MDGMQRDTSHEALKVSKQMFSEIQFQKIKDFPNDNSLIIL